MRELYAFRLAVIGFPTNRPDRVGDLLLLGSIMVLEEKTEIGIVVAFISGLDRVVDPWREQIAFVRSTAAARVQSDLIKSQSRQQARGGDGTAADNRSR
jgi:hypothetical protein